MTQTTLEKKPEAAAETSPKKPRAYSGMAVFVANLPYAAMGLIGAAIIALTLGLHWKGLLAAGGYASYAIAGSLWIIIFLCPYCALHGTRGCPCGYATVSALLRKKGRTDCFDKKFKRHIPVIIPLWFIPLIVGGWGLWKSGFDWVPVALMAVFAVDAFIVLPMTSTGHSCSECPQSDNCPWMKKTVKKNGQAA